jgi:hypothetical protein
MSDTDYTGYLMVFAFFGEGPGVWQVQPDQDAGCEYCGTHPAPDGLRMYRTVALHTEHDPQLGICQVCLDEQWANRRAINEAPDPDGSRPHIYPPLPRG